MEMTKRVRAFGGKVFAYFKPTSLTNREADWLFISHSEFFGHHTQQIKKFGGARKELSRQSILHEEFENPHERAQMRNRFRNLQ